MDRVLPSRKVVALYTLAGLILGAVLGGILTAFNLIEGGSLTTGTVGGAIAGGIFCFLCGNVAAILCFQFEPDNS